MNKEQFLQLLSQSGYPEPIEVWQPSNGHLDTHTHPFAVRALVVEGFIEITLESGLRWYSEGEMFELAFEQAHSETYSPAGVKYWASRKQ